MKTNRRTFLKQLGALALCLTASPLSAAKRVSKLGSRRITILHTNDVHSRIEPFPATDKKYPNMGGYARRKAYIDAVRNEGNQVLVFECGDMFQGTPYFNFYKGKLEIDLMNRMGVDAVTIGNHEFDNGLQVLCDRMEEAKFPFLCANYQFKNARAQGLVKPYTIFERAGIKIGVFGLGVKIEGLINPNNTDGTVYNDPVECATRISDELRSKGCDVVIALSHLGFNTSSGADDIAVARATTNIDMILGGHSHTFLHTPEMVTNKTGKQVMINQVGFAGICVGRIDIDIDDNRQIAYNPQIAKAMV